MRPREIHIRSALSIVPSIVIVAATAALIVFAVRYGVKNDPTQPPDPIRISGEEFSSAVAAWEQVHGTPPTRADESMILDRLAEEEALFRRALELGLTNTTIAGVRLKQLASLAGGADEHGASEEFVADLEQQGFIERDPIVRSHLVQTMRMIARKVDVPLPDELLSFYEQEANRFARPPRYDVEHIYFSAEKRGRSAELDAAVVLDQLTAEGSGSAGGDRFKRRQAVPAPDQGTNRGSSWL